MKIMQAILPQDDGLLHQTGELMCRMGAGGGEPEWLKHSWWTLVPPGTDGPCLNVVFTVHPNQNLIHGFATLILDNVQYNLRGCRELSDDMTSISVGPLSQTVVEPFRRARLRLWETANSPIHFDLEVEHVTYPSQGRQEFQEPDLAFKSQWTSIIGPVSAKWGYINVGEKSYFVRDYVGIRYVEWGVRGWGGGYGVLLSMLAFIGDRIIRVVAVEREVGHVGSSIEGGDIVEKSGEIVPIVSQERELTFESDTRDITEAKTVFTDAKGRKGELIAKKRARALSLRGAWIGEGPYDYKGPYRIESDSYDLSDPEMSRKLSYQLKDQYYEYWLDGERGYGLMEYYISKKHPKYGAPTV